MIYTCYDMARDCRAGRPQGWSYFVSNYVPVVRKLLAHYDPGRPGRLEQTLATVVDSGLFAAIEPVPERWFIAELRQRVLAQLEPAEPEIAIDLETVAAALEPLTVTEKLVAWIETMGYGAPETGAMLRMAPATVTKIRARSAELTRAKQDAWKSGLLAENGLLLGRAAAAAAQKECLPPKSFLDILDGRTTWRAREEMERHVTACWHCIDHFCRMAEVVELLRGIEPLPAKEAEPILKRLGKSGK